MNKLDWINLLPHLWDKIITLHWNFIQTEESMEKLNQRKLLEGYLNQFLSIAPHERKFFLTETNTVLKNSVKSMSNFSAHKAMNAFQSISHYADNLATKPWRKEYRTVKMYSGYYQHEIKSNLIDAEIMFKAMGYEQLPNDTMVFEGSICLDQVLNVSRDAMVAYVECQIMMQIYVHLRDKGVSCTWEDIFDYRQNESCGVLDAIKKLRFKKRDYANCKYDNIEGNYANINMIPCKQVQRLPIANCRNYDPFFYHNNNHCVAQPCNQFYSAMEPNNCQQPIQIVDIPSHYDQRQEPYQHSHSGYHQMSHSKSLEHYSDRGNINDIMVPQRHSFDIPHDVTDNASKINNFEQMYGPYNVENICDRTHQNVCTPDNFYWSRPYNVSGNRYPLPFNISQGLSNAYTCNELPSGSSDFSAPIQNHMRSGHSFDDHRDDYYKKYKTIDADYNKTYQKERKTHSTTSLPKSDYNDKVRHNERLVKPNVNIGRGYSFDGVDESTSVGCSYNSMNSKALNQEKIKNQDGCGSFEDWNYVFKNLENSSIRKDLGDNRDLQGLDLNLMNLISSTDKRRQTRNLDQEKLNEISKIVLKSKIEDDHHQKQTSMSGKNGNVKTILKHQTTNSSHAALKSASKSSLKSNGTNTSNNNMDNHQLPERNLTTAAKSSRNYINEAQVKQRACEKCTILNPATSRKCHMCDTSFHDHIKPTSV